MAIVRETAATVAQIDSMSKRFVRGGCYVHALVLQCSVNTTCWNHKPTDV